MPRTKKLHSGFGYRPLCGQEGGHVITKQELAEGKRVTCKKCLREFEAMYRAGFRARRVA